MDPAKRDTHVIVEEDLLTASRELAEERGITFSELYRGALRRELNYPSLITEIRDLREGVDKNLELIGKVVEILEKHAKLVDKHVKREVNEKTSV